jgi:hypothetical protein
MKHPRIIVCSLAVALIAVAVPLSAQTAANAPAVPPTVINHAASALSAVASNNPNPVLSTPAAAGAGLIAWLAAHGQSGQGIGFTLADTKSRKAYSHSVLLT